MQKLIIPAFLITLLSMGAVHGCGEDGPKIVVDLNVRNLCNYGVSVEIENRCMTDADCPSGQDQTCWFSPEDHFQDSKGFCRECSVDGECPGTTKCDHGWCHETCVDDSTCLAGEFCTASFCRKPHVAGTQFAINNSGNKDLEIYMDQISLHGADDACVFSRFEWSPPDTTITLPPGEQQMYINVKFTPPGLGEYRGFFKVPNNSINFSPLLILMCGQAVESVCNESEETCPPCASCAEKDFEAMIENEPTPDCSDYF